MTPTLTSEQQRAATTDISYVEIVAGAGSGKTATIIARYRHILETSNHPPMVVIVTFTIAAANELKRRIEAAQLPTPEYVGTIHGWCTRLVSQDMAVASENVATFAKDWALNIMPDEGWPKEIEVSGFANPEQFPRVYKAYVQYLARNGMVDYDGLLRGAVNAPDDDPSFEAHLIVDEFQDTGPLERLIYAKFKPSVTFVGDPRQALYGWRGAESWNPVQKAFQLTRSFRVPAENAKVINRIQFGMDPMVAINTGGCVTSLSTAKWIREHNLISGVVLCRSNREVNETTQRLADDGIEVISNGALSGDFEHYRDWLGVHLNPTNQLLLTQFLQTYAAETFEKYDEISLRTLKPITELVVVPDHDPNALHDEMVKEFIELYPDPVERLVAMQQARPQAPSDIGWRVMTIHQAKGLEWPNVSVVIPQYFKETPENKRLLYVAMTRASSHINLDCSKIPFAPAWVPS
jgi:superfamily I DNA/RNA helicase